MGTNLRWDVPRTKKERPSSPLPRHDVTQRYLGFVVVTETEREF